MKIHHQSKKLFRFYLILTTMSLLVIFVLNLIGVESVFASAFFLPSLTAVKTDILVVDSNNNALPDPGDTIGYQTVLTNGGIDDATGVIFDDTIDAYTTLVAGSLAVSPIAVDDIYPQTVIGNVSIDSSLIPFSVISNDYLGLSPAATITFYDTTTSQGGQVVMTTSGAGMGQFTYNPPAGFEGTDTFTYVLTDNPSATSAVSNRTGIVTLSVSGMVWFINNNAGACVSDCGRLSAPFNSLAAFNAFNNGTGNNPASGDNIFIYESASGYSGAVTLLTGQKLIGQDATQSLSAITGLILPSGSTSFPAMNNGNGIFTTLLSTVTINSNVTVRGLSINSTVSTGMDDPVIAISGVNVGEVNVSTTTGTGVNFSNTSGSLSFTSLTTSSGTGVNLVNNPGGSFTFMSVAINSGGSVGFSATGGGTINVCDENPCNPAATGALVNTLTSTTATALSVINTTIGSNNLEFTSISSNGGSAAGIILDTTGASGGLKVIGDGSNTLVGGNSSGGAIANKNGSDGIETQGVGIYLNNTSNVVLRRITINGTNTNYGIRGHAVSGFTLEYSTVSGSNGTTYNAPPNNAGEGSIYFGDTATDGISIAGTFTNNIISGGQWRNLSIINTANSGTTTLTFKGNTFGANSVTTDGDISLAVENRGTATLNTIVGGTLAGEPNTFTSSRSDSVNFTGQTASIMDVVFRNNTVSNNHPLNNIGGSSLTLSTQGSMTFHVTGNTFRDSNGNAITLFKANAGTLLSGFFDGNTIGVPGVLNSGSANGNGIYVSSAGAGTLSFTITNNQIHQIAGNAHIYADNTGGSYTANFRIEGNTFDTPGAGLFTGVAITNGAPSSSDTVNVCAKIGGFTAAEKNIFNLPTIFNDVYVYVAGASGGHSFNLPGLATPATLASIQTFINNNNLGLTDSFADVQPNASLSQYTGFGTNCGTPISMLPDVNKPVETYTVSVNSISRAMMSASDKTSFMKQATNENLPRAMFAKAIRENMLTSTTSSSLFSGENVNVSIGTLPMGKSVTIAFRVTVDSPFPAASNPVCNQATITSNELPAILTDDPDSVPPDDATCFNVLISTDLVITKTDGITTSIPGASVTYTITASNGGPNNDPAAVITDTFPASITGIIWTCTGSGGGTCLPSGSGDISQTVNLPSGGSVTFTATGLIISGATGSLSNTAAVATSPGITDSSPGNNTATDTDTLTPQADLLITKADSAEPVNIGDPLTYTLSITNSGLSDASGVLVTDTLPTEVSWIGDTCTAGPPTGQLLVWNVGAMVSRTSSSCEVYVIANSVGSGVITNTALIGSPTFDPNLANNTATESTKINTSPALSSVSITSPINEGETAILTGTITDPDTTDSFTLLVDWGDGSAIQTFAYGAGTSIFNETHQYLDDNPTGTASDNYTVDLSLSDSSGGSTSLNKNVAVNNVVPVFTNVTISPEINEGDSASLTGIFTDTGILDTFTLVVDWGDGSMAETFNYAAGITSFNETHIYVDDNPSGTPSDTYTVTLSLADDDTGTTNEAISLIVNNLAPALINVNVISINENGTTTLSGSMADAGVLDSFTLIVNWGDSSPAEPFNYVAGTTVFSETHQYLDDNPTGTPVDDYAVTLTLADDDGGKDTANITLTVSNVAPSLSNLVSTAVAENGTTTLSGLITDPGTLDSFALAVDWGDGSVQSIFNFPAGTTTFTETHQYLDDNPTATPADLYTLTLTLTDDDTGNTLEYTNVTVSNVAPTLSNLSISSSINEGQTATLTGDIADVGTLDTFRLIVDWGDGSSLDYIFYPVGTTVFTKTHLYIDDNPPGTSSDLITVTLNLADDDLGVVTDTVNLIVNNLPPVLSNVSATPVNENSATTLTGNISDAGIGDTFTMVVDWGDGTTPEIFNYGLGTTSFSETHIYADDNPTGTPEDIYLISLTLTDHDLGSDTGSTTVTVSNVAPVLSALSATSVDENGTSTLIGSITDPGVLDTFTLLIDWGDGSPVQTFNYITGTMVFSETHQYLDDNPTGTPSDVYTISLTLTDDDTGSDSGITMVTVNNVAPSLSNLVITNPINEGNLATLTGNIFDQGQLDDFILTVDWGDGMPPESFNYVAGTTVFTETHIYADDDPTGTPSDPVAVQLTLTDDDTGSTTDSINLTVNNIAPVLSNISLTNVVDEGDIATLAGNITDPGLGDTFSLLVDWGDGITETFDYPAGTTVFTQTHLYLDDDPSGTSSDAYTVYLTLTDDDTGRDTASTVITVNNVAPILFVTYTNVGIPENSVFTVTGTITDPGTDTFTYAVDWGDGTVMTYTYPVGTTTYTLTHIYVDDNPTGTPSDSYFLSFSLADDDNGSVTFAPPDPITVLNVAPSFSNLNATSVNENGTTTLSGTIVDPSFLDTFTMEIAWGDGSVQTYTLPAGTTTFTQTHTYLDDDPSGTPADTYTLTLNVIDDDTGTGTGTTSLLVSNLAPVLSQLVISAADENSISTLTGVFTDTGTLDSFSLLVDWGDGITETFSYTTTGAFTKTHTYLDTSDYTVLIVLTDDDTGQDSASLIVPITNVPPIITSLAAISPIDENGITTLTGTFFDPGSLDTFTLQVAWGDGSVLTATYPAGSFDFQQTHQYLDDDPTGTPSDTYSITVTLMDDDGGTAMDGAAVTVNNLAPIVFAGPDQAVPDTLPVSFTGVFTDVGSLDTHTILWAFGDGLTATGTLTPTHLFPGVGTYVVSLTVTDDDTGMGTDTMMVTVLPVADLALLKQAVSGPILSGTSVVYTLTVSNLGPSMASSVTISDTLPGGVFYASSSGNCSDINGVVTCDLGALAAGASASIQMTATVSTTTEGLLTNSAEVFAADTDPNPTNNFASATVEAVPYLVVFEDDFETPPIQPEWDCADPTVSTTPIGDRNFLGEFAAEDVCLNLVNLPEHAYVRVAFDLFLIRSWDGNYLEMPPNLQAYALEEAVGPDIWKLQADGSDILSTTFANWPGFRQSYPGNYPSGDYPALTGAAEIQTLGYEFWGIPQDAVYHLNFTFAHSGDTLDFDFISQQLQDIFDESWGLDNVVVMVSMTDAFGANYVIYLPLTVR